MSRSRLVVDLTSSTASSRASCKCPFVHHASLLVCPHGSYPLHKPEYQSSQTAPRRSRNRPVKGVGASLLSGPATSKRRTRSALASTIGSANEEELTDDFPPPSMIGLSVEKK